MTLKPSAQNDIISLCSQAMDKDTICGNNNIKVKGEGCTGAECRHTIETKFILFQLGCYEFKMLIVILKVITKKITLKYMEKEKEGNQSGFLSQKSTK